MKKFEEVKVWQDARELTRLVYSTSKQRPFAKDFGLSDQIRRASVSIMSNIAEGFERDGTAELLQFLAIAKGSAGEIKAHLCVALDQDYINKSTHHELSSLTAGIGKQLGGLMKYLREAQIKGIKYKRTASGEKLEIRN